MTTTAILFPAFAMFLLTTSLIAYMAFSRFSAAGNGEVSAHFYELYRGDEEPDRLRLITRHVQNHFEVPPLFYVAVLMAFSAGVVNAYTVAFAWLYVLARCVHTAVHLGGNVVIRRFQVFGLSLLMLVGLWGSVLVGLL